MKHKIILSLFFVILLAGFVSAEASYCCERIAGEGPWCQNAAEDMCDPTLRKAPTHCDSTDYCRRGCCYNSNDGTCIQNTAQKICEDRNGVWENEPQCNIPQCELGCCLLGNQASLVTQTRCKRLSSLYGLGIIFKQNIKDEFECVSTVVSREKGACVFEKEHERTCSITTRGDCFKLKTQGTEVEFYSGRLCSDATLATNCGPSEQTTCVEGKDQVYYLDTCGNIANVYDSQKEKTPNYWAYMKDTQDSCNSDVSNANSATCGNCNYFAGSTCKEYDSSRDTTRPALGDHICRDLSCTYEGDRYEHGEAWCAVSGGVSQISRDEVKGTNAATENVPGSRYFRLLCYNGEVTVEPCAEYRQEICIGGKIEGTDFRTAACRVNRWEDCSGQTTVGNCHRDDLRDCKWIQFLTLQDGDRQVCVPRYAPGFEFDESRVDAQQICERGNQKCVMEFRRGATASWDCDNNCKCDNQEWKVSKNNICIQMGDCGSSINYRQIPGYYTVNSLYAISGWLEDEEEVEEELES